MSKQLAVRLPDDLADFVDQEVTTGRAPNRAAVITRALDRERRLRAAEADIAILTSTQGDLDGLVAHVASLPIDLD